MMSGEEFPAVMSDTDDLKDVPGHRPMEGLGKDDVPGKDGGSGNLSGDGSGRTSPVLSSENSPRDELTFLSCRLHRLNSECESGYDETPSECDIKEVEEEEGEGGEEGVLGGFGTTEVEIFTDEGRESAETAGEELEEDSLASTTELVSEPILDTRKTIHALASKPTLMCCIIFVWFSNVSSSKDIIKQF